MPRSPDDMVLWIFFWSFCDDFRKKCLFSVTSSKCFWTSCIYLSWNYPKIMSLVGSTVSTMREHHRHKSCNSRTGFFFSYIELPQLQSTFTSGSANATAVQCNKSTDWRENGRKTGQRRRSHASEIRSQVDDVSEKLLGLMLRPQGHAAAVGVHRDAVQLLKI